LSSEKIILVTPASTRTIDRDVDKMASAMEYVSDKFGKRQNADFEVTVLEDVSKIYNRDDKHGDLIDCVHQMAICTAEGECIDIDNSTHIPFDAVLVCPKCGLEFTLFRDVNDLKNSLPEFINGMEGVVISGGGQKTAS